MKWHFPDTFVRIIDRITQFIYLVTDGRLGEKQLRYSILLLSTTGRKTGKIRTHALLYIRDGDNFVVCASNNGAPQHPAWYLNLKSHPYARIQVGRIRQSVHAKTASLEERERLWPMLLKVRPHYGDYQATTFRELPLIILKPLQPE